MLTPGKKFFKVQIGHHEETISIDQLKIAHVDKLFKVWVAQPPCCDCPPHLPTQPPFHYLKSNQDAPRSLELHTPDEASRHWQDCPTEIIVNTISLRSSQFWKELCGVLPCGLMLSSFPMCFLILFFPTQSCLL